jgi:putative addiction module CopG family antidote
MARVAVSVSITPGLAEFITSELVSGRYQTASEVVRAALYQLKIQREQDVSEPVKAPQPAPAEETMHSDGEKEQKKNHPSDSTVSGTRIIIVEDDVMISLALQDIATDLGCTVVGTATRIPQALALLEELRVDVAILDINLGGATADRVANAAVTRGIPIVFATGYGKSGVPAHLQGWPVISKPYTARDVEHGILAALKGVSHG